MTLLQFAGRSGWRRRRCFGALSSVLFLTIAASWLFRSKRVKAEFPTRAVEGQSETVYVPMVSEPWTATAVPTLPPETKRQRFRGYYPGFLTEKRRANDAQRRSLSSTSLTFSAALSTPAPATGLVFNGPSESDTSFIPPDPVIAAGPNQVVVLVNSLIAIYSKAGLQQGGYQTFNTFFSSLGGSGNIFDPRILYDQTDNRFILSAAEVDETNFTIGNVLVAVSQTSDPTGVWYKFAINFKGRNPSNTADTFPDFPTLGLSSSAIYISTGQFMLNASCLPSNACSFSDTWIKVIGLPQLLAGSSTLNITTFTNVKTARGIQAFAIEPALTYGTNANEYLVAASFASNPGTTLNVFAIDTSGTPTLVTADLSVPKFSLPPNAPQPGLGVAIATNDFRLLNAVWASGALWCSQNVADTTGTNAVAAWYEISLSSLSTVSLGQSGTVGGSGSAYFPAISVKPNGDVGVVFSTSSPNQYASAAFTGRSATDAPNTMRSYSTYKTGTGTYSDFALRWGDYSGIAVDPDGSSFWTIAEYAGSPNPHFGTAIAQIYAPSPLNLSSSQLNFGAQTVNFASVAQSVTITNASASPVTLAAASISGANAAEFAIRSDTCSGVTIAPAGTCTIAVTFTPASTGTRTAVLTLNTNPASFPVVVYLVGYGILPTGSIVASPSSLSFPDTAVRGASAPQGVTLKNIGTAPFIISYINVGSDFSQQNNCGSSIGPGSSCTLSVTFRPRVASPVSGELDVVPTELSSSNPFVAITLSGNGITAPALTPCPATVVFGNQTVGTTSSPQAVTINNTGSSDLTISSLRISGDFAGTSACGALPVTLPARTACNLQVTFTPTATGARTGTITIVDNAAGSPQIVALSGTGVAAGAALHNLEMLPLHDANSVAALGLWPKAMPTAAQRVIAAYGQLPLSFEANKGQTDPRVRFLARRGGYTLFLTSDAAVLALQKPPAVSHQQFGRGNAKPQARNWKGRGRIPDHESRPPDSSAVPTVLRMGLLDANSDAEVVGLDELPTKSNYFRGNDSRRWQTNVPHFARVEYRNVYPGVDLVYYGRQGRLEYDLVVAPGANPNAIKFRVDGAKEIEIDKQGDLVLQTDAEPLRLHKPVVYQVRSTAWSRQAADQGDQFGLTAEGILRIADDPKVRTENPEFLCGRYVLGVGDEVSFEIASYNGRLPLVIDPKLTYSTYLGGSGPDRANGIAVDSAGNAYVTGSTSSADFPIANAFQPTIKNPSAGSSDAFISKISADGATLIYSTFLGGTASDSGNAIAVDAAGNAYVTGTTASSDFPVTPGAFQRTLKVKSGFGSNAFVTKLSASGSSLLYSTYLGGTLQDLGNAIAVDSSGDAYVAGDTASPDFPVTSGALQVALGGALPSCAVLPICGDVFLAKINATASALLYSTYLGGSGYETARGIALDAAGNVYVAGFASSNDFPVTSGAYQTGIANNPENAFVAKVNPLGTGLIYSTYLGGDGSPGFSSPLGDEAWGIAVDSAGNAYVAGQTNSVSFPTTPSAFQPASYNNYNAFGDAFVTKLHPAGCGLIYSTYLGGFWGDGATAISVDSSGNAYIAGRTSSPDFPTVNPLQASCVSSLGIGCPFVSKLDPSGGSLVYSTFLSGTNSESNYCCNKANAVAVDSAGNSYIAGETRSSDFPTLNPIQSTYHGQTDGFVAKINPTNVPSIVLNPAKLIFPDTQQGATSVPLTVTLNNPTTGTVSIGGTTIYSPFAMTSNSCGTTVPAGMSCTIGVQFTPSYTGLAAGVLTINDNAFAGPHVVPLYGVGFTPPSVSLSPGVLVFGGAPIGTPVGPVQVMLRNGGSATLKIASIAISGDFSETTDCGSTLAGYSQCSINITFTPTGPGIRTGAMKVTDNAADSPQTLPLSGSSMDFSLLATLTSATVTAGQSTSYTISVMPMYGLSGTATLTCSGAPSQATCTVSPSTLAFVGTQTANVTVTVTTTARSLAFRIPRPFLPLADHGVEGLPFWIVSLVMLATLLVIRRRVGTRTRTAVLAASLLFVGLWAACGGGGGGGGGGHNGGTPAGTYSLDVTATVSGSETLTHDIKLQLTVN